MQQLIIFTLPVSFLYSSREVSEGATSAVEVYFSQGYRVLFPVVHEKIHPHHAKSPQTTLTRSQSPMLQLVGHQTTNHRLPFVVIDVFCKLDLSLYGLIPECSLLSIAVHM